MSSLGPSAVTGMGLETVVAQMPTAVIVVEAPSGRILHVNARARDMTARQLGRRVPPELTPDWEIFHPDGRPYTMDEWPLVRSITSGEDVIDEEYFNELPDGGRMIVRASSSPVYDDEGAIVAGVLVMADVTEQKRVEERLASHASLLDIVDDAVVGTDAEFRLTVWNPAAERLYGFAADDVLGRDSREVATYEGDTSRLELEHELLEDDRTRTEITAHRKDGTPVEVELIAVAVRNEQGVITGYLGIHRDISERKRLEEKLTEVRDAERRRLARDLHDEALQELSQALALAQRAAAASPDRDKPDPLVPALKRVSRQLRGAIYDLRLEEQEDRPFPHLLEALVARHAAVAVDSEVHLDVRDDLPSAPLGRRGTEILRIVGEALTNARRHSGAAAIRVSASGSHDRLCVDVSDDGRGFDPDASPAATAGAGIAGMRERAELLDAALAIRSRPGKGTTVRLELALD